MNRIDSGQRLINSLCLLRVLTDKIHPRYMTHLLEEEGKKAGFSRSYRASIDRIQGLSVYVPDIEKQNHNIEIVLDYEKKKLALERSLQELIEKRNEILNQFLR